VLITNAFRPFFYNFNLIQKLITMENSPQKSGTNPLMLVALLITTGLAAVMSYFYFDQKKTVETQETTISQRVEELSTTRIRLDSISTALNTKIAEVQKLGGDVEELLTVKARLEADKLALQKGNAREIQGIIGKYAGKIKEYDSFLMEKDTLISQLQREKGILTATNENLSTSNKQLNNNIQTLNTNVQALSSERQQARDSVAALATKNTELSTKVNRAAVLKAQNLKIYAVSSKGKVQEDDTYKAKRIDKIKLTYSLLDNPITKEEPKDVYVRVLDPDGAVVSDLANGSGTFMADGAETIYTTKQTINYDRNGQKVELLYTRGTAYKPGKYTVELFSEGYKIGTGQFAVR
jgi:hypothetical protein